MLNNNSLTNVIQQQVGNSYNVSSLMVEALQTWDALYKNQPEWAKEGTKPMNLPAAIAGEIARTTTIEMSVEISGSARAEFLQTQMDKVISKMREQLEYGNAKGSMIFKPYPTEYGIGMNYVPADMFYPIAFDADQNVTACVFLDWRKAGAYWYVRLEFHRMLPGNYYIIQNRAFRTNSQNHLGGLTGEVALNVINEWAELPDERILENITQPLFGYFRYPQANNIDTASPLGVSCFARAVDMFKEADEQWKTERWEFKSGRRKLYVDKSALEKDKNGKPILPDKDLYAVLNLDPASINEPGFFKEWSPVLRYVEMSEEMNNILRHIEFLCSLSYGVLSNPNAQALTATEIKNSQQRYYSLVTDNQKALKTALNGALYAMDVYTTLYNLAPAGAWEAVYSFDDSIVADHDTAFNQDKEVVGMGFMSGVEFRMRNYGESEEVARQKVAEAQAEKQGVTPVTQPVEV